MNSRLKIWLFYIIGLHLLVLAMLWKSDFLLKVQQRFGIESTQPKPEISKFYRRIRAYHQRMDASVPDQATLFIGDSITQGLAVAAVRDRAVNFGVGSDTTLGVLQRLPYYHSITRAKAVVIAIGANDQLRRENSEILQNFRKILQATPQDVPIIVSAILPVDESVPTLKHSNASLPTLNEQLRLLTGEFPHVSFLDVSHSLIDADGNLKAGFHIGDGLHLNASGYQIWIEQLRAALPDDN